MLNRIACISILALPIIFQSTASYAVEELGIDRCIQKHPAIEHALLSAFKDPNPKGNRPIAYYQIGAIVTREGNRKSHIPYLVVKHQSDECQAFKIDLRYGYEPLVPGQAAIDMEIHHFNWEARNHRNIPPKEEQRSVDPAQFGHGCDPVPITQAIAMERINEKFECPVMKTRQPLIWDQQ